MSQLVKIANLKLKGNSLENIAQALDLELDKVKTIDRVGAMQVRFDYKREGLTGISRRLAVTTNEAQLLVRLYVQKNVSSTQTPASPKLETTKLEPKPYDVRNENVVNKNLVVPQKTLPSSTKTVHAKKSPVVSAKKSNNITSNRHLSGIYETLNNLLLPYIRQQFVDTTDVIELAKHEKNIDVSPQVARNFLLDATQMSYSERRRAWTKTYALQGYSLVEISRLLGNQHIYTTAKILKRFDLHIPDGFDYVDPKLTLAKMPVGNWTDSQLTLQQREIKLICAGASFTEIAEKMNYKPTTAGQRIRELGLYDIWQTAQHVHATKRKPTFALYII